MKRREPHWQLCRAEDEVACVCDRCTRHAATLGLAGKAVTQVSVRKAFRAAARTWHPDRYENQPARRAEAEETFKQMQVAYRELWEPVEAPLLPEPEAPPRTAAPGAPAKTPEPQMPVIFFGGLSGCYTAPNFPAYMSSVLIQLLHGGERPLGLVEMTRRHPRSGVPAEYVLFTSYRMVVHSALNLLSMLWYTDLGEVRLAEQRRSRGARLWRSVVEMLTGEGLTGIRNRYTLAIERRDGQVFYQFAEGTDDSMKKVVYNFLRQMKA